MIGIILKVDGTIEDSEPKLSLEEMYIEIGCTIVERVQVPHGEMWCDETGKLTGKKANPLATRLFCHTFPHVRQLIVGDVYLRIHQGWGFNEGRIVRV